MNIIEPRPVSLRRKSPGLSRWPSVSHPGVIGLSGLALVLGGAILLGCSPNAPVNGNESNPTKIVAPAVVLVSIRNLQFSPLTIEVSKGDVVEWKNEDLVPHTATSASFNSGPILSGQSWSHTFTDAGTVSYICTFHPLMKGTVIVR